MIDQWLKIQKKTNDREIENQLFMSDDVAAWQGEGGWEIKHQETWSIETKPSSHLQQRILPFSSNSPWVSRELTNNVISIELVESISFRCEKVNTHTFSLFEDWRYWFKTAWSSSNINHAYIVTLGDEMREENKLNSKATYCACSFI